MITNKISISGGGSNYPFLDNNKNFEHQPTFNYNSWDKGSQIYLKKVPFLLNSANKHFYKFDTEAEKIDYYKTDTKIIEVEAKVSKVEQVVLNVPLEEALKYNYIMVESPNKDFIGETEGIHNFFYYILDVKYSAPNTTYFYLELDVFNTYVDMLDFNSINLSRGHLPHYLTEVETYLQCPIKENTLLLDSDVGNYSKNIKTTKFYPFQKGSGGNLLVITSTSNPDSSWENQVPNVSYSIHNRIPTGNYVWAIDTNNHENFLNNIKQNKPQLLGTITSLFVVPKDMCDIISNFTLEDTTCYVINSKQEVLGALELTKDKWGYPEEYADFSKLYTSQYSNITLSGANGQVVNINIEELGYEPTLEYRNLLDFPFLKLETFLSDYGGIGSSDISVRPYDTTSKYKILNSKWEETIIEHNIPTFQIYIDNISHYEYRNKFLIAHERETNTNTKNNTIAVSETERLNSHAIATNTRANTYLEANKTYDNSITVSTKNRDNAVNTNNLVRDNQLNSNQLSYNNNKISIDTDREVNTIQQDIRASQYQNNISQEQFKLVEEITTNNMALVGSFASAGADVLYAPMNASSTFAQGIVNHNTNGLMSEAQYESAVRTVELGFINDLGYSSDINGVSRNVSYTLSDTTRPNIVTISKNASYGIIGGANNTKNTNVKNTTDTNANNVHSVESTNIANTRTADVNVASNTAVVEKEKADNLRDTLFATANDKDTTNTDVADNIFANTNAGIDARRNQAKLGDNIPYAIASGEAKEQAWGYTGVHIYYTGLNESDVNYIGQQFTRYGYMLNRRLSFPKWHLMSNCTYWEFTPELLGECSIPNKHIGDLLSIFKDGITVWKPNSVVGDYTNNIKE